MNFGQSFMIALNMLRLHKLRAFLTMLGVIIGVMAVTLIVMPSDGFLAYISTEFEKLGADTIILMYDYGRRFRGQTSGGIEGLENEDIEYILNHSQLIAIASGFVEVGSREVRYGNNEVDDTRVQGVDEPFFELNKLEVIDGRYINDSDVVNRANVCMIGEEIRERLFGDADPIGKRITFQGITLEVVGVVKAIKMFGESTGKDIQIPITTVQDKWVGGDKLAAITMKPKAGVEVEPAMQEVWEIMMNKSGNRPIYRIDSRETILEVLGGIIIVAGTILGAIAALSLLVGGIGIMNIMLVSVTERTREIGLRKALGAKRLAILSQFLVEAAVLSASGGLIGMGIGWLIGQLISITTASADLLGPGVGLMVSFPMMAALIAVGFSALVGIVFGIYPAWSASRLDPIVALRSE